MRSSAMYAFERQIHGEGYKFIAGVDEVGRGALAGPVVAAAVIFPPGYLNDQINDSKKLSAGKREIVCAAIRKEAIAVGIGVIDVDVIDSVNILQASLLAMREAVLDLSLPPDFILIDGLNEIPLALPQRTIIKGDALSVSIAAASIVAKVSRDRIMEMYHRQFPQYNFLRNKGYGTREHRLAVKEFGLSKIHRKSFHCKDANRNQTCLDWS